MATGTYVSHDTHRCTTVYYGLHRFLQLSDGVVLQLHPNVVHRFSQVENAIRLGQLDVWPHRSILLTSYPVKFVTKYPNVIGYLDATEIFIQTPSSLVKQSQTYSQYKHHSTVKGLIVTDANGAIIFVSSLFTGSISDRDLLQESHLMECMQDKVNMEYLAAGDIFLADKGFRVDDLFQAIDLQINIPTFKMNSMQFSPEEVWHTRRIAHERVHVERAIARLKSFKILSHKVPISLLGSFNQIWTVCALLCNFRMPLRSSSESESTG